MVQGAVKSLSGTIVRGGDPALRKRISAATTIAIGHDGHHGFERFFHERS